MNVCSQHKQDKNPTVLWRWTPLDVLHTEAPAQGLQDKQVGTVKGFQLGTPAPSAVRVAGRGSLQENTETHLGFQENLRSPGQWFQHPQGPEKPWWLRHSTRSTQHSWVQPGHRQFLVCPQVIPELANTRPEGEHGEGCWGWGCHGVDQS